MRITLFVKTAIGYVAWPPAVFGLGLASGLAGAGHEVRVVEPRRNNDYVESLRRAGSEPARRIFRDLPNVQRHTYEPRSGARLLEWLTREVALLDVAVAVEGLDVDLCRLLASISHLGLTRAFVGFDQPPLSPPTIEALDLGRYDVVFSPSQPAGLPNWKPLLPTLPAHGEGEWREIVAGLGPLSPGDGREVARAFERGLGMFGEPVFEAG